jgi:hypothetical protein
MARGMGIFERYLSVWVAFANRTRAWFPKEVAA